MKRKICLILIISIILLILINTFSFGAEPSDIYDGSTPDLIKTPAEKILGIAQVIGYASAVIMVAYMGTKYILATPEGKSDLKKQLVPFAVGIFLLFASSIVITVIADVAKKI